MKVYPLNAVKSLFSNDSQTFQSLGIRINPSLEGVIATPEMLAETTSSGLKKLLSLEFNWLPAHVVKAFNSANSKKEKKQVLINKVYGNCRLNCKGCYVKQDDLYMEHDLLFPEQILNLIEEAVQKLGTTTLKYLGPSEFFRDPEVFQHLDRFQTIGVALNIFAKDPMFGDDSEVSILFGSQGLHTSEQLVKKLASYPNLRILYNFRSFDDAITNDLVRGGYPKDDYTGNYKDVQSSSLQLLYKYFVKQEIEAGREGRLVILNTPIIEETVDEAFEIFKYFIDRGVPVCSTASMQSGCGGNIYSDLSENFLNKLAEYYAKATAYSVQRGVIISEYARQYGPSPYAGVAHCMQLCNGLMIRATGQLVRCPGADHEQWRDAVTPEELVKNGLVQAWVKTRNYQQDSWVNIGCLAKPKIFTPEFKEKVVNIIGLKI